MRFIRSIPMIAIALSFGATAFASSSAQAAPCCSAPICQQEEPPNACNYCLNCAVEEEVANISEEPGYDEVEGLCLAAADDSVSETADLEPGAGCQ
ncbi:hypothetical protein POL58_49880 [Nannocystis sp. ncelm1]|uniref:Secreted protein n=2 Tax=Nannocystis radixulma TaxID=2995305 RepID=A0ABT5BQV1_9BACT|nr:hypothetical protein [Nannocystis radixulma]